MELFLDIDNSSEVIKFLRTNLAQYMATNRYRSRKWSKLRVADFITTSLEIEGTISDTSIGRFLDENHRQVPSVTSVRLIAEFLLDRKAITRRQVDCLKDPAIAHLSSISSGFFGTPRNKKFGEFLDDLSGVYYAVSARDNNLLVSELRIKRIRATDILTVREELNLYKFESLHELRDRSENLSPRFAQIICQKFSNASLAPRTGYHSSGFVLANWKIMTCLLNGGDDSFSSVLSVDAFIMNDGEKIGFIRSQRYLGWHVQELGEISLPAGAMPNATTSESAKFLSKGLEFQKYDRGIDAIISSDDLFDNVDIKFGYHRESYQSLGKKRRNFTSILSYSIVNTMVETTNTIDYDDKRTPDGNLAEALRVSDIELFKAALANGANADFVCDGHDNPMIFGLAGNGRIEWVETLINTGRCDVSITDRRGMTASHEPGVTAIEYGPTQPEKYQCPTTFKKYNKISNMIDQEAIRQSLARQSTNKPKP